MPHTMLSNTLITKEEKCVIRAVEEDENSIVAQDACAHKSNGNAIDRLDSSIYLILNNIIIALYKNVMYILLLITTYKRCLLQFTIGHQLAIKIRLLRIRYAICFKQRSWNSYFTYRVYFKKCALKTIASNNDKLYNKLHDFKHTSK